MSTKPVRKRSDQNFRRLPDKIAAPLLQALLCIPAPQDRLVLRRPERPRPPTRKPEDDYAVISRSRQIGRIWRHDYRDQKGPWHWNWEGVPGRTNASGHGPTLEAVMADFRRVWDARS